MKRKRNYLFPVEKKILFKKKVFFGKKKKKQPTSHFDNLKEEEQ